MSGFNSFVVRECTTLTTGVLVLGLEFNEISITLRDDRYHPEYQDHDNIYDRYDRDRYDRNRYDRDRYDSYRDRFDRNSYEKDNYDRQNYDRKNYDRNSHNIDNYDRDNYDMKKYDIHGRDSKTSNNRINYQDNRYNRDLQKGEFRDYGIPLEDSFRGRSSDREGDIVRVYGLIMEYGYVSKSAAIGNQGRPLTGVRINLSDVEFRYELCR